jgi:CubicO group peptidase (beta-lactamase class C family)
MFRFIPLFLSLLCVVAISTLSGQKAKQITINPNQGFSAERLRRIDSMVTKLIATEEVPGAVVFISRNGKPVLHKAYGYSDHVAKTSLKKDDIFRIASQTKAITSLGIMMLWEEGKFQLDEPISNFIPEFKNPKVLLKVDYADTSFTTEPAGKEITFRHLLTHTSGLDYPAIGSKDFKAIYAKHDVPSGIGNAKDVLCDKIKILATLPLKHKPGEKYTYGLNTDVLGYLIELLSGKNLDQFFRERIFQPLGMNDTYFYLPESKHSRLVPLYDGGKGKAVKMVATAYDNVDPDYPKLKGTYYSGGAGLSSTIEDYSKFLQLFLNKGTYNGKRLISRKTIELMLTNQTSNLTSSSVGLGFGLETPGNDHLSVLSLGSFSWGGAFNTHYWADPKENFVALIFTNIYQTAHWNIGDKFKVLTYQAIGD